MNEISIGPLYQIIDAVDKVDWWQIKFQYMGRHSLCQIEFESVCLTKLQIFLYVVAWSRKNFVIGQHNGLPKSDGEASIQLL